MIVGNGIDFISGSRARRTLVALPAQDEDGIWRVVAPAAEHEGEDHPVDQHHQQRVEQPPDPAER